MPETVSITEAAARLGVTPKTIARRLDSGKLECVIVEGKRRVVLPDSDQTRPDATGHQTGNSDRTSQDTATIEALKRELDRAITERDREREEVTFLRQRLAEMNAIVMRHALSLPNPEELASLPSSVQATGQDRTQDQTPDRTGHDRTSLDTKQPLKRRLPIWLRFFGFRL